jgi:hypothetical protein
MYAMNDLELCTLQDQSAKIQQVLGPRFQPGDPLLIPWFPGAPDAPAVPCGLAKVIRPERVAELADTFNRLREEDLEALAKRCLLSERQVRQYFDEFSAYWRGLKHDRKALVILVK